MTSDGPPLLPAVDEDPEALAEVETQLLERYGRDYRVKGLRDPMTRCGR